MNITLVAKPGNNAENISIDTLPFLIGRDESPFAQWMQQSNEMHKAVHHISRHHAKIFEDHGKILIQDLGSKNGTNLNGRKLGGDPVEITHGDSVKISQNFVFLINIEPKSQILDGAPVVISLLPVNEQPGLDKIDITAYPFDIGRKEEGFQSYEGTLPEHVVSLSRKHARITYRDHQVFVEDLGSTNGTTLSGRTVGRTPVPIKNGDHILFGQHFEYIVKLVGKDVEETIALESETIKEPDKTIVTAPPQNALGANQQMDIRSTPVVDSIIPPEARKNVVYIGATQEKPQATGQTADVDVLSQETPALDQEQPPSVEDTGKQSSTVYMSSATQFLKILTSEDKEAPEEDSAEIQDAVDTGRATGTTKKTNRILSLVKEIVTALSEPPSTKKRWKWWALGCAGILIGVVLIWAMVYRMPEQKLKRLMAGEQYLEYLKLSNQILSDKPDKEEVRRTATDALMRAGLPDYTVALNKGHIDAAKKIVDSYAVYTEHNPEGQKAIGLLTWITDLEAYFIRNDPQKPINLFRDEAVITPIVSGWDANEDDYRSVMEQMVQRNRTFEATRSRVYHHLNVLKLKAVHFDSVKALNRTIEDKLADGRNAEILTAIDLYQRRHPDTEGLSDLRREAENFIELDQYIRSRDVVQISAHLKRAQFQTPVFRKKVNHLKSEILPEPELGENMAAASRSWTQGNTVEAFTLLEGLTSKRWGDLAASKLKHYQQVVGLVEKVNRSKGTSEHTGHLLALRRILIPEEDQFWAGQIEEDFASLRDQEIERSQELFDSATSDWTAYSDSGRITGLLRLESTVSKKFAQRAGRLKTCFEQSRSGVQIYKDLGIPLPEKWGRLSSQIADEVIAQRLRIEDLAGVLGAKVSSAKLALLPVP